MKNKRTTAKQRQEQSLTPSTVDDGQQRPKEEEASELSALPPLMAPNCGEEGDNLTEEPTFIPPGGVGV